MEEKKSQAIPIRKAMPIARREFCRKAVKRSLAWLVVTAGAVSLSYKKPSIKSFFGGKKAYAQVTGAGKFSLRGGTSSVG